MTRETTVEHDLVAELLRNLTRNTRLSVTRLRTLEADLRRIYGGRVHYVSRGGFSAQLKLCERNEAIRAAWSAGIDQRTIARNHKLSSRRVRQICADLINASALSLHARKQEIE